MALCNALTPKSGIPDIMLSLFGNFPLHSLLPCTHIFKFTLFLYLDIEMTIGILSYKVEHS